MKKYDIIISGGSMVGLSIAKSLSALTLKIALIEAKNMSYIDNLKSTDGRAIAISAGSKKFLEDSGIWSYLLENMEPMLNIKIEDNNSPITLNYDSKLVSDQPMGYMIESNHLIRGLYESIKNLDNVDIIDNHKVVSYNSSSTKIEINLENDNKIAHNQLTLEASLLIAADGKDSHIRHLSNIDYRVWEYHQNAIIFCIEHEKHHQGIAYEKFCSSGPFAILPLKGGYQSGIVWTEKSNLAPFYLKMNDQEFHRHLMQRIGTQHGEVKVTSKKLSYLLSATHAREYYRNRLVLIGDSAHSMHPIAGQGFNVGIRDIIALQKIITESLELGLDIGSTTNLEKYVKARQADNSMMIMITDKINRLFSNNYAPIKFMRNLGLGIVENITPLKKYFMIHAMFGKL